MIISKPANYGTKLEGPELPDGIVPVATITAVNDLGLQPAFEAGKSPVDTLEFIFTTPAGEQGSKKGAKSLHEKAFLYQVVKAVTREEPGENVDTNLLVGQNVALMTTRRKVTMGKNAGKMKTYITSVAPASPNQPTVKAPATRANVPQTANVGF